MKCPACGHLEDRVIDTRSTKEGSAIRRRRQCLACEQRFTTYEEIELDSLYVIKRDGRREPFDRAKLERGVRRATEKRPIPAARVEEAVERLAAELHSLGLSEVTAAEVGERVMALLRDLDEVAYVRFASVYRRFRDVSQFMEEVRSLRNAPATRPAPSESPESPARSGSEGEAAGEAER